MWEVSRDDFLRRWGFLVHMERGPTVEPTPEARPQHNYEPARMASLDAGCSLNLPRVEAVPACAELAEDAGDEPGGEAAGGGVRREGGAEEFEGEAESGERHGAGGGEDGDEAKRRGDGDREGRETR